MRSRPRAGAQPFGDGQQAVLHVFRAVEDDGVQVELLAPPALLRERVIVRQPVQAAGQAGLGAQHVQQPALQQRAVGHGRGQHHERVVVGRGVAPIPEIAARAEVARESGRWPGRRGPASRRHSAGSGRRLRWPAGRSSRPGGRGPRRSRRDSLLSAARAGGRLPELRTDARMFGNASTGAAAMAGGRGERAFTSGC